jgi:hypothetical protein
LRGADRAFDLVAQIIGGGEFVLIAKDRRQPLGNDAIRGQPPGKRRRNPEFLKLAVEPFGELFIFVAVAEKCVLAAGGPGDTAHVRGVRLRRRIVPERQ